MLAGVRFIRGMVGKCCRRCVGVVRLVGGLGRLCEYGWAGGSCGVRGGAPVVSALVSVRLQVRWVRFLSLSLMKLEAATQSIVLAVRWSVRHLENKARYSLWSFISWSLS